MQSTEKFLSHPKYLRDFNAYKREEDISNKLEQQLTYDIWQVLSVPPCSRVWLMVAGRPLLSIRTRDFWLAPATYNPRPATISRTPRGQMFQLSVLSLMVTIIHLTSDPEGNSFVFPRVLMFTERKSTETSGLEGKQNWLLSRGTWH